MLQYRVAILVLVYRATLLDRDTKILKRVQRSPRLSSTPQMENYRKCRVEEEPCACPFVCLPADTPQVRVKDGSKIRNLLRFAFSRMEAEGPERVEGEKKAEEMGDGQQGARGCSAIIFTATGKGVAKAITCAELVKRQVKGLHQLTRLQHATVLEEWEPLEPAAGLDCLRVSRKLPAIWILLSRVEPPEGADQPGYQAPGRYDALWAQEVAEGGAEHRVAHKRKRGGGGSGSRGRGSGRPSGRSREAGHKGQS